jgi:hypothetical protein
MLIVIMNSILAGAFVGLLLSVVPPRGASFIRPLRRSGLRCRLSVLYAVQLRRFTLAAARMLTAFPEESKSPAL